MKNIDIENLLEKYSNGNISEEELRILEMDTHRNEVMRSAIGMATDIRRKRWKKISYVTTVIVLVIGVGLFLRPLMLDDNEVVVAKTEVKSIPVETVNVDKIEPTISQDVVDEEKVIRLKKDMAKKEVLEENKVAEGKVEQLQDEKKIVVEDLEPMNLELIQCDSEPQVLCNVHCDADSVINEVWNFLKA